MKKIILAAALFVTAFTQAQDIQLWNDDQQIENNGVYTYNVLNGTDGSAAKMHLLVINNTSATINIKLKMFEVTNNPTGTNVQFCFGQQCYFDAPVGTVAPPGGQSSMTAIPANGSNGSTDYFFNNFAGVNTSEPVTYKMGIINIDAAGAQVGEPIITFTYKYDPTASTTDFASLERIGIVVNNTIVKNSLDLTANTDAKLDIVNINGQIVRTAGIANGTQSVDLSSVAAGVYFARFTTSENKTAQIKFVKN